MKNEEKNYLNVILTFATVQCVISILQFSQSSINSNTELGKWFGAVGVVVVAVMMLYMYKFIKQK